VIGASRVIVAGAVKEEPIVATEAEEFGTPADQLVPVVHDPPVAGVHADDKAGGATIPRTVSSMLWLVAPGTFSSDRFNEYVPENTPVVAVTMARLKTREEPDARFVKGASVVENTLGALAVTPSRSSFAVQAVPSEPARLKMETLRVAVPDPSARVPKSMSRVVSVLPDENDPMAWSSTLIVAVWANVGVTVCGLVAIAETVPVNRPAVSAFTERTWVLAPPRAMSDPVPEPARNPDEPYV